MKYGYFHRAPLRLCLVLLAASVTGKAQTLTNKGGTLFVNTGGTLQVNGGLSQTGTALLRTAGTATVTGTLNNNATLDLADGQVNVAGDMLNGLFASMSGTTGTLRLYGSANQRLNAFGNIVPNLTVDKSGGTATMNSTVMVRRVLTLAGTGNLDTGGQLLRLISDASGTALVVNSGTGVVTGTTATVQRYIDGSLNAGRGYRHLSSPVSGGRVYNLSQGMFSPTVNTAYNTSATPNLVTPFPTVFGYDQARLVTSPATTLSAFDKGWYSPADLTDALTPGLGYTAQLTGNDVVEFTGTPGTGDYALPLARNAGATAADAGWNLVGNPYPAPLDFGSISAGQRSGMDAAFYTYESTGQYAGQYRSFVNGFGNPLVGSSQAFFVRVSSGQTTGSLTLTNANRVTDYAQPAPVRRDQRPQLQLTLSGQGLSDALTVYAQAGATAAQDADFDAVKLWNPSGLSLATVAASGQALAIDGRPAFPLAQPVPLTVQAPRAGQYSLTAATVANLPAGTDVTLVDLSAGTRTLLTPGASYGVQLPAGTTAGRLQLEVSGRVTATTPAALAQQLSLYPNPTTSGQVQLVRPAAWGAVQVQVLSSVGQLVQTTRLAATEPGLDVRTLPVGVYTLRLTTQQGQTLTKRLVRQ